MLVVSSQTIKKYILLHFVLSKTKTKVERTTYKKKGLTPYITITYLNT